MSTMQNPNPPPDGTPPRIQTRPGARAPRVCSREGCGARATHFAGLILKAAVGGGMQSLLDLPVCPAHARRLKVEEVVSDDGWDRISAAVEASGKMPPLRGRTQIYTCPIDEAPAVFRDRYES